jgi:hypothetical protein
MQAPPDVKSPLPLGEGGDGARELHDRLASISSSTTLLRTRGNSPER